MGTPGAERTQAASSPAEVAVRFRGGDLGAFREVYHRHVARVYALALRMSGCAHRAEDLTQEVFLRAWAKRGTLRDPRAIGPWLMRLAANLIVSRSRRELRRRDREARVPDDWEAADPALPADPDGAMDLERAITGLPPGARAVFVLHDIEGYTHEEIAGMVGIAQGTSKAHLHRARALLRREVER